MALPLPKVVYDIQPGGGFATDQMGINALKQSNIATKYAPYTTYADAASKLAYANMLPYQIQAQVMSNPMVWMALKDNPEAIKAFMGNFQKQIPSGSDIFGGVNLPAPGSNALSGDVLSQLLGKLKNKLMGGNETPKNALAQGNEPMGMNPLTQPAAASSNSGMFPSAGMAGYGDIKTAPFSEQLHEPGKSYIGPDGKVHSTAANPTVADAQTAILATQRVTPQLNRIASEAEPFMTLKGKGKVVRSKVRNLLGGEENLPSEYAKFQADIEAAPEALVKSYGLNPTNETIKRMANVIEPHFGESASGYKNRILNTLEEIRNEQKAVSEKALSEGVQVSGNNEQPTSKNEQPSFKKDNKMWPSNKAAINEDKLEGQVPPKDTKWMIRPDGMKVPVHNSQVSIAKNQYHFREV